MFFFITKMEMRLTMVAVRVALWLVLLFDPILHSFAI